MARKELNEEEKKENERKKPRDERLCPRAKDDVDESKKGTTKGYDEIPIEPFKIRRTRTKSTRSYHLNYIQ
jgi:hypothetical protein